MRIVRAVAAGEIDGITVRVDRILAKGGKPAVRKSLLAVWQARLPGRATVWLNDATADAQEIEAFAGQPVSDETPRGRIAQQFPAVQLADLDIKKSTAPATVVKILRGVFSAFPQFRRVGIIIDKTHVPLILGTARKGTNLDECFRQRVAKVEHFRSGASRGSNDWMGECDALIVAGTPRVPPSAVRTRLIQAGNTAAAARDGEWERDYWTGTDATGRRHTIKTAGYRDHDWHQAHRAIVRAELLQAVGRGRGILEAGLPVMVISNENLGLPLCEIDVHPLPDGAIAVLDAMKRLSEQKSKGAAGQKPDTTDTQLTEQNSKEYLLEITSVSTSEIASAVGKSNRWVLELLKDLFARGLVQKIGQRGGWVLSTGPDPSRRSGGTLFQEIEQ